MTKVPLFVVEPKGKPLSEMTREEIEALADEIYDQMVPKVEAHRKASQTPTK